MDAYDCASHARGALSKVVELLIGSKDAISREFAFMGACRRCRPFLLVLEIQRILHALPCVAVRVESKQAIGYQFLPLFSFASYPHLVVNVRDFKVAHRGEI